MERILFCLVLLASVTVNTANSQSTFKTTQAPIDVTNVEELHLPSNANVIIKTTSSSRVIITQTISVHHPTKDVVIAEFIKTNKLCELDVSSDFIHRRLSLSARPLGHIAVDNKVAEVKQTYEIFVPENLVVRKG